MEGYFLLIFFSKRVLYLFTNFGKNPALHSALEGSWWQPLKRMIQCGLPIFGLM